MIDRRTLLLALASASIAGTAQAQSGWLSKGKDLLGTVGGATGGSSGGVS